MVAVEVRVAFALQLLEVKLILLSLKLQGEDNQGLDD
jgi:hypothetical protein